VAEREVTVRNYPGIHAHPAVLFVKMAAGYRSDVFVQNGSLTVNGKSIMGVLMLAAETGTKLVIRAEGPDADDAVNALSELVESRFGEGAA